MDFTKDPNDRRRVDPETQRNRDAEVATMRRSGVPFRTIGERLGVSLGAVQKALRRAQSSALERELGAVVGDDELSAEDVQADADVERLDPLERHRLRYQDSAQGEAERARVLAAGAAQQKRKNGGRERFAIEHADELAAVGFDQAWYSQESFRVSVGQSWRDGVDAALRDDSGTDAADDW